MSFFHDSDPSKPLLEDHKVLAEHYAKQVKAICDAISSVLSSSKSLSVEDSDALDRLREEIPVIVSEAASHNISCEDLLESESLARSAIAQTEIDKLSPDKAHRL